MEDKDCVRLLQQILPQLRMRWPGFRKVRKQVCKRIQRRLRELGIAETDSYLAYLQSHHEEWRVLDHCCRVTVSRFYRDKVVLEHVARDVLPVLAEAALVERGALIRGWSAGCAMGEEAYSLVLIWDRLLARDYPRLQIEIVGSDIDAVLLQRAARACYGYSSVKALPDDWLQTAFTRQQDAYCLEPRLRSKARFVRQDIRDRADTGPFQIVFCRNMAFTYYDHALQLEILEHIRTSLVDGGALVIGGHEMLPAGCRGFEPWSNLRSIFRKASISD
jgi:chemotaxis protein methyltransferase CheR